MRSMVKLWAPRMLGDAAQAQNENALPPAEAHSHSRALRAAAAAARPACRPGGAARATAPPVPPLPPQPASHQGEQRNQPSQRRGALRQGTPQSEVKGPAPPRPVPAVTRPPGRAAGRRRNTGKSPFSLKEHRGCRERAGESCTVQSQLPGRPCSAAGGVRWRAEYLATTKRACIWHLALRKTRGRRGGGASGPACPQPRRWRHRRRGQAVAAAAGRPRSRSERPAMCARRGARGDLARPA